LVSDVEWLELSRQGIRKFAPNAKLYIRPMYWADAGLGGGVKFDPASTRWCLTIYESPMPEPKGASITLSPHRRPTAETAPVAAKAGCLYPNNGHALLEAGRRGFDNCLLRDGLGNIAELANANVFLAKDGVVMTPVPNGTFLDGITRRRVIGLLRADGVTVLEKALPYEDFLAADEIFSSGNFNKLAPMTRIEDRTLSAGPLNRRARSLYWDFAHSARGVGASAA
jgi:branched-chain amino acid aminotransferase